MSRNEAQTRQDLIDPALFSRGWDRDDIREEEMARAVDLDPVTREARRRLQGRTDYVLRRPLSPGSEPLPLAILEAKREGLPAEHGLQQGQDYRTGHLHHVPFVFSTNGHLFVEFDALAGLVSEARPLTEFPTPQDLVLRYCRTRGLPEDPLALRPLGFFDVIIIDECHRSAWGDWHDILTAHPQAIHIGLTATPRQIIMPEGAEAVDTRRLADHHTYFGDPVYEYRYLQGVEDGYLAPPDIEQYDLYHDRQTQSERVRGIRREDLAGKRITVLQTGQRVAEGWTPPHHQASALETRLFLPDRIKTMCGHLFGRLCATGAEGSPCQKTIVFCASDHHADLETNELNNLYSAWLKQSGVKRQKKFAFKCMDSTGGQKLIPDFRGSASSWFIATTKDLLSTGVDVPRVRNIVFFRYVQSPILLTQMVGRGTRLHEESGKLVFLIFDYTGVTGLLGRDFFTRAASTAGKGEGSGTPRPPSIRATGLTTEVQAAGHFTVAMVDGRTQRITWPQYEQMLVQRLLAAVPNLDRFRHCWLDPAERQDLLELLKKEGLLPDSVQGHCGVADYDLYDVLASVAYGVPARTRTERAAAFAESATAPAWLIQLPQPAASVIRAIVRQFEREGTPALDSPELFSTPEVKATQGLKALQLGGNPHELLRQTRETIFVA